MADSNSLCHQLVTGTTILTAGATNAILYESEAGLIFTRIKILPPGTGGSVIIIGVSQGVTLTGTSLVAGITLGYCLGATEVFDIPGPARFYLASLGTALPIQVVRGKNA